MTPEELYQEWTDGDSGLRPQRVQALRTDLQEATGMPVPHRVHELEGWIERMKGQVTRKLKEARDASEPSDDAESTSDGDDEE